MNWFDTLLWPLMVAVAWIMVMFHKLLTLVGLESGSGLTWTLSIVGLVLIIRVLLIPLFVRQIKAARGMQMLSPELQALQKKYQGRSDPASREAMTRETMELYRKHGTNPFASCLPILAQSPIFFALFRVLSNLKSLAEHNFQGGNRTSIGPLTERLAQEANNAQVFGAKISDVFLQPNATTATRVVSVSLIVLMSITTFTTQRQLTQKNMPASAMQGPMAQQQKMLLYILPLVFALSGVNFPIGVLIYWSTTNLWSMGQQFYVIRRNPTPGSEAERMMKERRARKAAAKGIVLEDETKPVEEETTKGQRQQPVRKDRAKARPTQGGARTTSSGAAARQPGSGAKSAGAKPAASGRPTGGTARVAGAKGAQAASTSGTAKSGAAGGSAAKSGAAKPSAAKSGAAKSGAAKAASAKPAAGKSSSGSSGVEAGATDGVSAGDATQADAGKSSTTAKSAAVRKSAAGRKSTGGEKPTGDQKAAGAPERTPGTAGAKAQRAPRAAQKKTSATPERTGGDAGTERPSSDGAESTPKDEQ